MKNTLIIVLLIGLLLALFLPRYLVQHSEQEKLAIASNAEPSAPSYKVMRVKLNNENVKITLPSYFEAINVTPLWARINGYLSNFLVDIGDKVQAGQLLAEISTPDVDEELARAKKVLDAFIAKKWIAIITAERWSKLFQANSEAVSAEEVDQMTAEAQSATADAAAAMANVERLTYIQGFNHIYAPFDGFITKRSIDIGTLITEGNINNPEGLFHIQRTDTLRAFVDVPQSVYYLIKDGLQTSVNVWQYPGKSFTGIVNRFANALDQTARTLLTQVNVDNTQGILMPGLYAEVEFSIPPENKTYTVPVSALIIRSGPPYLAVVKPGNIVALQEVKIGRDYGSTLEIIDGLSENDEIVTNPSDRLQDKMHINAVPLSREEETLLLHP